MKKITRRGWTAIGVASVLAGAAIAIPVGVVYGIPAPTPVPTPPAVALDESGDPSRNIEYAWGTKGGDVKVPVLNEKAYVASDYETGKFQSMTVDSQTLLGTGTAKIVFLYAAKTAGQAPLKITYSLNVKKGYSRDLSKAATQTIERAFESEKSPNQIFTEWMAENGYGYTIAATDYKNSDDTASSLSEVLALGKDMTFKVVYRAELDTAHYETTDKDGAGAQTVTTPVNFTLSFKVLEAQAAKPAETSFDQAYTVGSTENNNKIPVNPREGTYKGYQLESPVASKITKQSAKAADSTHLSPAIGADVNANDIPKYNEGTGFDVTYAYKVRDNYVGTSFSVVVHFTITAAA